MHLLWMRRAPLGNNDWWHKKNSAYQRATATSMALPYSCLKKYEILAERGLVWQGGARTSSKSISECTRQRLIDILNNISFIAYRQRCSVQGQITSDFGLPLSMLYYVMLQSNVTLNDARNCCVERTHQQKTNALLDSKEIIDQAKQQFNKWILPVVAIWSMIFFFFGRNGCVMLRSYCLSFRMVKKFRA